MPFPMATDEGDAIGVAVFGSVHGTGAMPAGFLNGWRFGGRAHRNLLERMQSYS